MPFDTTIADPHAELGVAADASDAQIRAAYRRLAARWHPDRNRSPQAAERMARINEAYRRICEGDADPDDEPPPGADDEDAEPAPRRRRAWWDRDWGRARWEPASPRTPQPLRHAVAITLEQAAFGTRVEIEGQVSDLCPTCLGGGVLLSRRSDCAACAGEGRVARAGGGWRRCAACGGDGLLRQRCEDCDGTGAAPAPRRYHFEATLPPGVRDGHLAKLRGQGQRGGGAAGDIELALRIAPHRHFAFDAEGRLQVRVPVDLYTALAGAPVEVPTLDGHRISVAWPDEPPAARPTLVLAGLGFPARDGVRGPLVVELRAVAPRRHSADQVAMLRRLADDLRAHGYEGSEELAAWHRSLRPPAAAERPGAAAGRKRRGAR